MYMSMSSVWPKSLYTFVRLFKQKNCVGRIGITPNLKKLPNLLHTAKVFANHEKTGVNQNNRNQHNKEKTVPAQY